MAASKHKNACPESSPKVGVLMDKHASLRKDSQLATKVMSLCEAVTNFTVDPVLSKVELLNEELSKLGGCGLAVGPANAAIAADARSLLCEQAYQEISVADLLNFEEMDTMEKALEVGRSLIHTAAKIKKTVIDMTGDSKDAMVDLALNRYNDRCAVSLAAVGLQKLGNIDEQLAAEEHGDGRLNPR